MDRINLLLSSFRNVSLTTILLASDNLSATARSLIAARVGYTIFVQKITVSVTTDNAATQTFQDTASTPVPIATSKASPGLGALVWDFGTEGCKLTADKGLDLKNSAAGLAAAITVQAYMKPTPDTGLPKASI